MRRQSRARGREVLRQKLVHRRDGADRAGSRRPRGEHGAPVRPCERPGFGPKVQGTGHDYRPAQMPEPTSDSPPSHRKPKLLELARRAARARQYSRRTEEAYLSWIRRYVRFHGTRHPKEMGAPEVAAFLEHLANEGSVSRPRSGRPPVRSPSFTRSCSAWPWICRQGSHGLRKDAASPWSSRGRKSARS